MQFNIQSMKLLLLRFLARLRGLVLIAGDWILDQLYKIKHWSKPAYKFKVNFIFRSGVQIVILADGITINRTGTTLVDYTLINAEEGALYIRAEDISAIAYSRN